MLLCMSWIRRFIGVTCIATVLGAAPIDRHPRVFVFTDINIDQGDPDDRQSLVHLLWYADELRIEVIGTHLLLEADRDYLPANWARTERPCEQPNWNGAGRNAIYNDPRFRDIWWGEMNWTYAGMFTGEEPTELFEQLGEFGALGQHIHQVVANQPWARYFRVGDTPSVLYVIDADHDRDDPTDSSWAGQFVRPFPESRPHYYTDHADAIDWNDADPCSTWERHIEVRDHAKGTLEKRRPERYAALLKKLTELYSAQTPQQK
jgi:hypothetical protein